MAKIEWDHGFPTIRVSEADTLETVREIGNPYIKVNGVTYSDGKITEVDYDFDDLGYLDRKDTICDELVEFLAKRLACADLVEWEDENPFPDIPVIKIPLSQLAHLGIADIKYYVDDDEFFSADKKEDILQVLHDELPSYISPSWMWGSHPEMSFKNDELIIDLNEVDYEYDPAAHAAEIEDIRGDIECHGRMEGDW